MSNGLIYPELSYSIIGAGMDEWDYHRALIVGLKERGHSVLSHVRKKLIYLGGEIDSFELDLLIDDLIVLELKHLKSGFHPHNTTQLLNYLKLWQKRLGILINFGQEKLRYERLPFNEKSNIRIVSNGMCERLGSTFGVFVRVLQGVVTDIGVGYSTSVMKKLLWGGLNDEGAHVKLPVVAPSCFGHKFEARELDVLLIEEKLMVAVSASSSATDMHRLQAYLKQSNVTEGVLVDMSEQDFVLRGVIC